MQAGGEPECLRRLSRLVLDSRTDEFRSVLTGKPAADFEPLRVVLKPNESETRYNSAEKVNKLGDQMLWLAQASMVRPNFYATYSSVVIAVPKVHGHQKVEDYRTASVQIELLSAEAGSGCGVDGVSV